MRAARASATRRPGLLCTAVVVLASCSSGGRYAVVTVEDPDELAGAALTLRHTVGQGAQKSTPLEGEAFPLTIGFESPRSGERALLIEAWSASALLGRAKTTVSFVAGRTTTSLAVLRKPCAIDDDCGDHVFCDATTTCVDGMCETGPAPCAPTLTCVVTTCLEEGRTCSVSIDHAACNPPGAEASAYCNPTAGCIEGAPCLPENNDDDCQDDSLCNGRERCVNFRCVGAPPLDPSDGDRCTLDGCDDNRIELGLEPVFNVPVPGDDGISCSTTSVPSGVCVASLGGCVPSTCGDGVVFGGEVCDDGSSNSDAWAIEEHCNSDCTGVAPFCGDGAIDAGYEVCDDGSRVDERNGCSNTCQRNDICGDEVRQDLFEQCDDGPTNVDSCDGCTTDCRNGCICNSPLRCTGGWWCGASAVCEQCVTAQRCGSTCRTCGPGERCDPDDECTPCDTEAHCGPTCGPCDASGPTPLCGGQEVGCVPSSCVGQLDFTRCRVPSPTRSYNICSRGVCVEPGCGSAACNSPGVGFVLPDTNQRACYDASASMACVPLPCDDDGTSSLCGQDAQYGWDTAHPANERFLVSTGHPGEPVVTDNVTGLSWQGCIEGRRGDKCEVLVGVVNRDWNASVAYCDGLVWGGFVDWRLPERLELWTLVDLDQPTFPYIDGTVFPQSPATAFWTSSAAFISELEAWHVNFRIGTVATARSKVMGSNTRCVRGTGNFRGGANRFARSLGAPDEPVVADSHTGLVWQGCAAGQTTTACAGTTGSYAWSQALDYCEGLNWGGATNWRLPSFTELSSIVDQGRGVPAIDAAAFPQTVINSFSTSTTWGEAPGYQLSVYFREGNSDPQPKSVPLAVRCVREAP